KAFGSYSFAEADKFKGPGDAEKENIDGKVVYSTPGGSQYSAGAAWNRAINDFYYTLSKSNMALSPQGMSTDYLTTFTAPATPNSGLSSGTGYYALHVNPFENMIANVKADMQLTDNWRLNIEPYFWYGNGGGSTGATVADTCPKKNSAGK